MAAVMVMGGMFPRSAGHLYRWGCAYCLSWCDYHHHFNGLVAHLFMWALAGAVALALYIIYTEDK